MVPWASAKATTTSKFQSDLALRAQAALGMPLVGIYQMRSECPLAEYCVGGGRWAYGFFGLLWTGKLGCQQTYDSVPLVHPQLLQVT